ncbi:CLUMA_CG020063, isoform A [Clunio marinus]|uniref:CLUMA_CG020063, isoform A n=1 Tax=Clunio marinus TaxID=568069 RepID=A0A1J1J3F6_9DIPT|nr:CLUMA_CG020063, isoform A [Clunio marinus]
MQRILKKITSNVSGIFYWMLDNETLIITLTLHDTFSYDMRGKCQRTAINFAFDLQLSKADDNMCQNLLTNSRAFNGNGLHSLMDVTEMIHITRSDCEPCAC